MPFKSRKRGAFAEKKPFRYFKPPIKELNLVLIFGVLLFAISLVILFSVGENTWFWLFSILGTIVALNAFWLRFNFAQPFIWKYVITMMKTKRFIGFIKDLARYAKWFEYVCLGGLFLGFGVFGVDYWAYYSKGRKLSRVKRIMITITSAIILAVFFYVFMGFLFHLPLLKHLFVPCLVAFILLGFGGMSLVLLLGYGLLSLVGIFFAKEMCPAIAPVIPGAPIPGMGVPIPLVGWISLVIILVVHEFSHGIMMVYYKEKIKSVGVLLAGIIPLGAFVEQDEKTFNRLNEKKSLMVLSAGSASNLFTIPITIIIMGIFLFLSAPFLEQLNSEYEKAYSGIEVINVEEKVSFCGLESVAPAKGKLFVGDVVKKVNEVDVNSIPQIISQLSRADSNVLFLISRKNSETNAFEDLNVSIIPFKFEDFGLKRIGVSFGAMPTGYSVSIWATIAQWLLSNISMVLFLLIIISFAAGSFNYLPSDPFDGGRMAKIILCPYLDFLGKNKRETQNLIGKTFTRVLIVSLALNLIPYMTLFF